MKNLFFLKGDALWMLLRFLLLNTNMFELCELGFRY
jgi:hypothetical protein